MRFAIHVYRFRQWGWGDGGRRSADGPLCSLFLVVEEEIFFDTGFAIFNNYKAGALVCGEGGWWREKPTQMEWGGVEGGDRT